jgi:hypothetical protein
MNYGGVFYKAVIRLLGTYGAQLWTLTNAMERDLATGKEVLERNVRASVWNCLCNSANKSINV